MKRSVRSDLKARVFADLARSLAGLSTCRRARVGAVVVTPEMTEVLAVGYNGQPAGEPNGSCRASEGTCGCVHAEANAIVKLSDRRGGLVLLTTTSPCEACAGLIVNCGRVGEVRYAERYRDEAGLRLLARRGITVSRWLSVIRAVVVGERANAPSRPDLDAMSPTEWAVKTMSIPAFADDRSREKLDRIGVDLSSCQSVNLLPPALQGVPWDRRAAKEVASLTDLRQFDLAYLAGAKVCEAFGRPYSPGDEVGRRGEVRLVAVPHPSGLNRFWNFAASVAAMRRRLCHLSR